MKADDEEKEPEEDEKEEKSDSKGEIFEENEPEEDEKTPFEGENESNSPEMESKIDVKSMSDEDLIDFIELAAEKLGLDGDLDEETLPEEPDAATPAPPSDEEEQE